MKGNPKPEDIKTFIAPPFEKQSLNSFPVFSSYSFYPWEID